MLNRREFLKVGLTSIFGVLGASHIKVEPDSIPVEGTNGLITQELFDNLE